MERSKRHDFVNIYSYGVNTKVIYLNVEGRRAGQERERQGEAVPTADRAEGRAESNISRARARVQELALCNEWEWFVTFTLDPQKYDRYNLEKFRKDLTQWIRNRRRLTGCDVRYLLIPERHKDGAWHLHGLLSGLSDSDLRPFGRDEHLPYAILRELDRGNQIYELPAVSKRFGWTTVSPVRDAQRCANYVAKYIRKDIEATADSMEAGDHLFYASRGLQGRVKIYSGPVANADKIPWGFENEYCKILWVTADGLNQIELDPTFRRGKR